MSESLKPTPLTCEMHYHLFELKQTCLSKSSIKLIMIDRHGLMIEIMKDIWLFLEWSE